MIKLKSIVIIGFICLLSYTCKEKSVDSNESPPISFYAQSSKCVGHGLTKKRTLDSVFTYSFTTDLAIDFSVTANCCPDSNRFSIAQTMRNDTILISVSDTAQSNCNCLCLYMIHAEYAGLPNDSYIVRCTLEGLHGVLDTIYLVNVTRTK